MISLGYIVKHYVTDQTALKYFDEFERQSTRLNNILDELLKLTKISYNLNTKELIDFEKIVLDCIASYKYLENYEKVKFNIDIEDVVFEAEWSLINSIVQNLIENGIKYARIDDNKPEINISVTSTRDDIVITAKDNGIGMDEETTKKIFSMFFRVNRKIEGTGLGLHILKRAVERLLGDVNVQSTINKGTTFTVRLPK